MYSPASGTWEPQIFDLDSRYIVIFHIGILILLNVFSYLIKSGYKYHFPIFVSFFGKYLINWCQHIFRKPLGNITNHNFQKIYKITFVTSLRTNCSVIWYMICKCHVWHIRCYETWHVWHITNICNIGTAVKYWHKELQISVQFKLIPTWLRLVKYYLSCSPMHQTKQPCKYE